MLGKENFPSTKIELGAWITEDGKRFTLDKKNEIFTDTYVKHITSIDDLSIKEQEYAILKYISMQYAKPLIVGLKDMLEVQPIKTA